MHIPPISSNPSPFPPGDNPLTQQLQNLIMAYRTSLVLWTQDPTEPHLIELKTDAQNLEVFLDTHERQINTLGKTMGWGKSGGYSECAQFLQETKTSIQNFLERPNTGSADLINENSTQLHWYLTHINSVS